MTNQIDGVTAKTTLSNIRRDLLAVTCLVITTFLTTKSISHGPLWGDDALLLRASRMPGGYASEFWLGFVQTGSLKYRPLLNPVLALLTDAFGNDQYGYLVITNILIGVIALLTYLLCRKIGVGVVLSLFLSLLVLKSRFNWYSQDNIFGIMEAGALIFVLSSVFQNLRTTETDGGINRKITIAVIFLMMATLVHERYLLLSFVFPSVHFLMFLRYRSDKWRNSSIRSTLFLVIPLVHVFFKSGLLNTSVLSGGGESEFASVKGFWIVDHFLQTMFSVLGLSEGYGETAKYWRVRSELIQFLTALVLLLLVMSVALFVRHRIKIREHRLSISESRDFQVFLILGGLIATSISAALVVERVEFRWIYGPYIFFVLLIAFLISEKSFAAISRMSVMLIPLLVVLEMFYAPLHKSYEEPRRRISSAITEVSRLAPKTGSWNLLISRTRWENWQWWQYGYGYVFTQLPNPPLEIKWIDVQPKQNHCGLDQRISTCVVLTIDGQSEVTSSFRVEKK